VEKKQEDIYSLRFQTNTENERSFMKELELSSEAEGFTASEKMLAFPLYVPRQKIAEFLYKYELFKKVVNVHGCVVECGVGFGSGLMSFAHFSTILEPVNYSRKIIGFDTFAGFPKIAPQDEKSKDLHCKKGGMAVSSYDEIQKIVKLHDKNRPIGHIQKVELVKGDATKTIPEYVKQNPHLIVSLLYLDFDIYEPTVEALRTFVPRMPKGSIIAFDELCHSSWPGETIAVLEEIGVNNLRIQRVPFDAIRSYAILG